MGGAKTLDGADLSPDTVLRLTPGLRTRWSAAGHVLVDSPVGTIIDIGPGGFDLLSLFSRPVRLGDAIAHLEAELGGATNFAPTMSAINMLIEESGLISSDQGRAPTSGWADPVEHARMLHDHRRTGDYLAALAARCARATSYSTSVPESGVLAVAAARAGARRVYAVEATDIADVAERVFEANGVNDRVTLVPGWSRQIDLPEKVDILVAEVIGNEPFEEEILETTLDARRRLLKPGARLVPHALTLLARPVRLPEAEIRQRAYGRAAIDRWRELYGIDFQPLLDAAIPARCTPSRRGRSSPRGLRRGLRSGSSPVISPRSTSSPYAAAQISWSTIPVRSTPLPSRSAPAPREHLAHARSLEVAGVELGDLRLGPAGTGPCRPRVGAPCAVPPPRSWRPGRAHLRACRPRLSRRQGAECGVSAASAAWDFALMG